MLPPKNLLKNTFFIKIMNAPSKSLFNKTGIITSIAKSDEIGKIATILPISSLLATLVMIPVLLTRLFGTEKPG